MKSKSDLGFSGKFFMELVRDGKVIDKWESSNAVTIEGRRHMLAATLDNITQISPWYVGIFAGNVNPDENYISAGLASSNDVSEVPHTTGYSETARQTFDGGLHATAGSISNAIANGGTLATFTFLNPYTIYGAFLSSSNDPTGDAAGVLMAISDFAARSVIASDQLNITYEISTTTTP